MGDESVDEIATERRAQEHAHRLFSYHYLKKHGLLQKPPRRQVQTGGGPEPEDDPDGDGGPPYAAALAKPVPEDEEGQSQAHPARIISAKR